MPWTIDDVESKKKGLSAEQKKRWVKIANSVLRKCLADGGSEETCAASAIRQANGVVGNEQSLYVTYRRKQLKGYEVTHQTHQGKEYLVVPVVMMVEGVHNGSHGPMLHTIEDLGRFPAAWNGIPVVIDHPEIEGQYISANEPDVIDARLVGRVYNTRVDGAKLVAQAWLDEERLRQISSVVLAQIEAGEPIEVSLGMFTEELATEGDWNGEQYEAIARNHRPDHLALLPGGVGACSIADGCGIRANKKGGQTQVEFTINGEDLFKVLKNMNKEGFSVNNFITDENQGYRELVDAVRQKLDSMDNESSMHFLQEVYDDTVIYEVRMRIGGSRLFKQRYTFNAGEVQLQGSPQEVRRKVEYIAMAKGSGYERTKFNINKKGGTTMAENANGCSPCVKKKVDELIANSQGKYTENDREMLETLTEELLDKMAKPIEKEVIKEVEKMVEVNKLTPEDQAALDFGKRQLRERRESWIQKIQANAKDVWTDDELKTMSDAHLEKLAKTIKKEETVDYSLNTGFNTNVSASVVEPLYPGGIEVK